MPLIYLNGRCQEILLSKDRSLMKRCILGLIQYAYELQADGAEQKEITLIRNLIKQIAKFWMFSETEENKFIYLFDRRQRDASMHLLPWHATPKLRWETLYGLIQYKQELNRGANAAIDILILDIAKLWNLDIAKAEYILS